MPYWKKSFVVYHDIIFTLILFSLQHYFVCSLGKVMGGKDRDIASDVEIRLSGLRAENPR
jgi:hypothetical protein